MVKARQIEGVKFRRQFSIGPYILDFYSPEIRLCIELDGAMHFTEGGSDNDYNRTEYLRNEHDIEVLRFENRTLYNYPEEVLAEISKVVKERKMVERTDRTNRPHHPAGTSPNSGEE
jgi:very-short-patch-repair endonuclease